MHAARYVCWCTAFSAENLAQHPGQTKLEELLADTTRMEANTEVRIAELHSRDKSALLISFGLHDLVVS